MGTQSHGLGGMAARDVEDFGGVRGGFGEGSSLSGGFTGKDKGVRGSYAGGYG